MAYNRGKKGVRAADWSPQGRQRREVLLSLALIVAVVLVGVLGYGLIEGWDAFDALYMTVITLTTVGYMEVHPLSHAGRVFTLFLILGGVGVVLGFLSTVAKVLLEKQFSWFLERNNMQKIIDQTEGHTVFCGYGRLSKIAAMQLLQAGMTVVVIEMEDGKLDAAREAGCMVIKGDATRDEILTQAGVARAKRVISLLPKDSDNLYVILTCRELNPALYIISRAEDEFSEKRIMRAGADQIIYPYRVGGQRIADGLLRPNVTKFLDIATAGRHGGDLQIEEILIPVGSSVAGLSLRDSKIRQRTNVMIAAVITQSGEMFFNPSSEQVIEAGATLIGLGHRRDFRQLESLLLDGSEVKEGPAL
jgi:voltage-gated potassium channel